MPDRTRFWVAGSVAAAVLLGAGGLFLGVQPQVAHAEQADSQTAATESQLTAVRLKVAKLAAEGAKQAVLEAEDGVLTKSVPSALQANTFIRRVNEVAALDGVTVESVTVGAVTAYSAPKQEATAPGTVKAPAGLVKTDPAITSKDFTVIPMTVVVSGGSDAGLEFAKDIQRDERLFLVSGYSTLRGSEVGSVTTTLTGSVYALKE